MIPRQSGSGNNGNEEILHIVEYYIENNDR